MDAIAEHEPHYIDWINELHELSERGGIDPDSSLTPRVDEHPDGFKLTLFDQQRIMMHVLAAMEECGEVRSVLPHIVPAYAKMDDIISSRGRREGRFVTNASLISMPVGSGKSLIFLGLIVLHRVPPIRRVIICVDSSHALLCSTRDELSLFPQDNVREMDLIATHPWYFDETPSVFPSISPHRVEQVTVAEEQIIPLSLFFVAPHLIKQMCGYCENQTNLRWRALYNMRDISACIIDMVTQPDMMREIDIIVIAAQTFSRGDTMQFETAINQITLKLVKPVVDTMRVDMRENQSRLSSLRAILTSITAQREYVPTTAFFAAYANAGETQQFFARVGYDDYDSLRLKRARIIPALWSHFISGTSIREEFNRYGFPSKPTYMTHARRAMSVRIIAEKVIQLMGLAQPTKMELLCHESASTRRFIFFVRQLCNLIVLNRELMFYLFAPPPAILSDDDAIDTPEWTRAKELHAKARDEIDPFKQLPHEYRSKQRPLKALMAELQRGVDADSIESAVHTLRVISRIGYLVGVPVLERELNTGTIDSSLTFGRLATSIYRRIYAEKMRMNLTLLSLDVIREALSISGKVRYPSSTVEVLRAWSNYERVFAYPLRESKMKEAESVTDNPVYTVQVLSSLRSTQRAEEFWNLLEAAKMHSGASSDDAETHDKIAEEYLYRCMYLLAPHFLRAHSETKHGHALRISVAKIRDAVTLATNALQRQLSQLSLAMPVTSEKDAARQREVPRCPVCSEEISITNTTMLCCDAVMCYRCFFASTHITDYGVQCGICGSMTDNSSPQSLIALPSGVSTLESAKSLSDGFIAMREHLKSGSRKPPPDDTRCAFYYPLCEATCADAFTHREYVPAKSGERGESILCDKLSAIEKLIMPLIRESPGRVINVLVHNPFADVNASIARVCEEMTQKYELDPPIKVGAFDSSRGDEYRSPHAHHVVIVNQVAGVAGFNMEYLDMIIMYSPLTDAGDYAQLIGRGQRAGRKADHVLHIVTLLYPDERSPSTIATHRADVHRPSIPISA